MAELLRAADVEALRGFQSRGRDGLKDYYEYLDDRGYEYGGLALGVVEQDTVSGRMANAISRRPPRRRPVDRTALPLAPGDHREGDAFVLDPVDEPVAPRTQLDLVVVATPCGASPASGASPAVRSASS